MLRTPYVALSTAGGCFFSYCLAHSKSNSISNKCGKKDVPIKATLAWGYKTFVSFSTELSMKFVLLINIKIPIHVILKYFLLNRAEHEIYLANNSCWHFNIYKQDKFHAQLSWVGKKFYNPGALLLGENEGDKNLSLADEILKWALI